MKYFIFPLVIGLMIVAGLNLYIDPSGHWRQLNFSFNTNWNKDQVWISPPRFEERDLRIKQIELLPKIDLLMLGSSRAWNVDAGMFPANVSFYNASVSGATLWDDVAMWQKFKQENNIPKHIIIYLDSWNFNKNTWQKYRWIPTLPLVLGFLGDSHNDIKAQALIQWLSGNFYEFSDLVSPAVLKVSLQELNIYYKGGELRSNYICNIADRPADLPAWESDGSHLFVKEDERPKTLEQINEIGRNSGMGSLYVYMRDWETDATYIKLLDYLLADTEKYGVDVLIVQPPFQQEAYKILKNNPEYKDIPGRYYFIIKSILKSHKNTAYCDVLDPGAAACTETEFMDSSHTLKSCARKIVNTCLKHAPEWFAPAKN